MVEPVGRSPVPRLDEAMTPLALAIAGETRRRLRNHHNLYRAVDAKTCPECGADL